MTSPNARSFAESVASWGPQSWWEMELSALRAPGAAEVHDLVLVRSPMVNTTFMQGSGRGCLRGLVGLIALAAPLVALGFLLFAEDDALTALLVPFAIIVGIGCLVVSGRELADRIAGRTSLLSAVVALAVMVSIPSGINAWLIWTRVRAGEVQGDYLWTNDVLWTMIPFTAMAVLPLLLMIFGLGQAPVIGVRPTTATELIDEQVRALSPETALGIRNDLAAAIAVLEARQVITRDVARRAASEHIGHLGLTMAPEVANTAPANRWRDHDRGGMGGTTTPL